MRKLFSLSTILFLAAAISAQDFLAKNEYFYYLPNHLNLFVAEDSTASDISIGLAFNCGAFIEDNGYDGLSFLYEQIIVANITQQLKSALPEYAANPQLIFVRGVTSYEYVYFSITSPQRHVSEVLQALQQSLAAPIDSSQVAAAALISNTIHSSPSVPPAARLSREAGMLLWGDNYSMREYILSWNDSLLQGADERLAAMAQEHFCPDNALLLVKGNVRAKEMRDKVNKIFLSWNKCKVPPAGRFPGYGYKSLLINTQFILEDSFVVAPFFQIACQGSSVLEGVKQSYCALLLEKLFENRSSKTHSFLRDTCGLRSFSVKDDKVSRLNQLTFYFTPDSGMLEDGLFRFRDFIAGTYDSLLFDEQELLLAKESVLSDFKKVKADNNAHLFLIGRYWKNFGIDAYSTFEDSVSVITPEEFVHFLAAVRKRKSVTGLCISPADRSATGIDTVFTSTAASITDYEFHFLKNSAKFAGAADDSAFNSLVQFLKINPELEIKVNGMCHQSELLDVADEEMLGWVREQEQFILNPPSLVQKKKFRLDVYRSLSLIRKLTNSGIGIERLFGTGNLVRTQEEPEKYQIANCSLTLK